MTTDPTPRPEGDDDRTSEGSEPPAATAPPDTEPATDPETDTDTETEPFLNPPDHERRPGDA